MPIYKGSGLNPVEIKRGTTDFYWVYQGSTLKWQKETESLLFSFSTVCGIQETYAKLTAHGVGGITPWRWDLGDGTIEESFSVDHSYTDNTEKTVRVYTPQSGISVEEITIACYSFTSAIDLSNINSFNKLFIFISNTSYIDNFKSGITFPENINGTIGFIFILQFNFTTLDFSKIINMDTIDEITLSYYGNEIKLYNISGFRIEGWYLDSVKEIIFAEKINGNVNYLHFEFIDEIYELNLSGFELSDRSSLIIRDISHLETIEMPRLNENGSIYTVEISSINIDENIDFNWMTKISNLIFSIIGTPISSLTFANEITGEIALLYISICNIDELDISMFVNLDSNYNLRISYNDNLQNIIFPQKEDIVSSNIIDAIYITNNKILEKINLSWVPESDGSSTINIASNLLLNELTFTDTPMSGAYYSIDILNCPMITDVNIYNIPTYRIYIVNNTSLNTVIIPHAYCNYLIINNCDVHVIDISNFVININQSAFYMKSNNLTAAEVNKILHDLDILSTSGYTGRYCDFTGTNAAPDSSSGGYNGTSAKASLQSKGFTVLTN